MWLLLLGQTAPTGQTVDPWTQLGVAGLLVGFAVWVVLLLLKMLRERDQRIKELEDERDRREAEHRAEIRELSRGQLELAERALPSLTETARVVAEASDELRRSRQR